MTWFWFIAFAVMLVWNVSLMRLLHIAQADVRRALRRDLPTLATLTAARAPRADIDEIRGTITDLPRQRQAGER